MGLGVLGLLCIYSEMSGRDGRSELSAALILGAPVLPMGFRPGEWPMRRLARPKLPASLGGADRASDRSALKRDGVSWATW